MPNVNRIASVKVLFKNPPLLLAAGIFGMGLFLSGQALALEYQCEIPNDTRYLRVEIPGQERLCEVTVNYKDSGERRVMWYADNDTLFCSAKFYALKTKYEDLWNFNCEEWPDLDGIDKLTPTNRVILDAQLKEMIRAGESAEPPFTVNSVRAVASTVYDKQPGKMALQFFLSTGDKTQIVVDNGETWNVSSTIDNLASHISSDLPVMSAFISSISDSGAMEIETTMKSDISLNCFGTQIVTADDSNRLQARSEHEYLCDSNVFTNAAID